MMLECWRHSAIRRPSFIQLLDLLAADLSDEFHNVSYYFNHEPDNSDAVNDSGSADGREIVSAEDVNETVPFQAACSRQPRPEPSGSATNSKVSNPQNLSAQNELQSSGFVGRSSTDRNPRTAELIELSGLLNATLVNSMQPSLQADDHERLQHWNSQQDSRETAASCRSDAHGVMDSESKDSSGSSLGSRKNGLVNGHIIPCHSVLHSEVH